MFAGWLSAPEKCLRDRDMRILNMIREAGSMEVSPLAEALGVFSVTICKDLA